MCGRFTLNATGEDLIRHFDLERGVEIHPRFNIAPTDESPIVRVPDMQAGREADYLQWGLVPFWADDTSIGNNMINARAETAHEKPAFRAAFSRRRCLVPASGFYEWVPGEDGKQPYYIRRADDQLLGFAGIWESWTDDETGEKLETFAILTGEPNDFVAEFHDRMPVVLAPEDYGFWLDPALDDEEGLNELVNEPYPGDELDAHPVSTRVNSPTNDDPDLVEPVE